MANQIGDLGVVLTANINQFKQALTQAQKDTKSFSSGIKSSFGEISGSVKGFIGAWAGMQGVQAVLSNLNEAGDLQDLANGLTVSAERLQELQAAGLGAGVTIENFQSLLQRVSKASSEAAEGNDELKSAFDQLGMSTVDLDKPDKVLLQIVEHLGDIPNAADRMKVAVQLAGKGGAQALIKMSADGVDSITASMEEARAAGLIMSNDTIKGADDASDAIGKLAWQFQQKLKIAVVDNKDTILLLAQATFDFLNKAIEGVGLLAQGFVWLGKTIGETAAKMAGYESGEDALARQKKHLADMLEYEKKLTAERNSRKDYDPTSWRDKTLATQLEGARIEREKAEKAIKDLATFEPKPKEVRPYETQYKDMAPMNAATIKGTPKNEPKTRERKAELTEEEKFLKSIDELRANTDAAHLAELKKQSLELEKQKALLEMSDTSSMSQEQQDERTQKLAEYSDALEEVAAQQQAIYDEQNKLIRESVEEQQKYNQSQRDAAEAILDTLDPLREQQRELDKVAVLIDQGFLPPETFAKFKKFQEDQKESVDWAKELGMTFQSAFQDAIINGNSFRDVLAGMVKDFAAIILKLGVMNPLLEAAFGKTGAGSSSGGFFGSIVSAIGGMFGGSTAGPDTGVGSGFNSALWGVTTSAKGNVFSGHINAFANGAVLSGPTLFPMSNGAGLAGEAGYEGILPLQRTASGKLGVVASGSGGQTTINQVTVNVEGGKNADETGKIVGEAVIRAIAKQEISAARRVGGINNPMSIGA